MRSQKVPNDEVGIRATDLALGLRRIPAGFYTIIYHSGLKWRTENKPVSVDNNVIERSSRQIQIPFPHPC